MGRRLLPKRIASLVARPLTLAATWSISSPFGLLSSTSGQITNALLTRSPLETIVLLQWLSFDLHVLGTPPAFILSQDQTLRKNFNMSCDMFESLLNCGSLLKTQALLTSYHYSVVKVRRKHRGWIVTIRQKPVKADRQQKGPTPFALKHRGQPSVLRCLLYVRGSSYFRK